MNAQYITTSINTVIILFAIIIIAKILSYLTKSIIKLFMKKLNFKQIERIKKAAKFTIFYSIIMLGIYYLVKDLVAPEVNFYIRGIIFTITTIIFAIGIKRILGAFVEFVVEHASKRGLVGLSKDMTNVIKNIVDITIFIIAIIVIIGIWGGSVGPLITSMGIVGAAIAFAAKSTISNFFSGLIIFFDKRIRVGDYIEFKDTSGEVIEIKMMSTRVRTWDNTLVTIPNYDIVNNIVEDKHLPKINKMVKVKFSFVYGTNVDKAKKVIIDTVKKIKTILKDPAPRVYLINLGDYSIDLMLISSVKSIEDVWSTKNEINEKVYNACKKAKLEFAFPTQTIELKKSKK